MNLSSYKKTVMVVEDNEINSLLIKNFFVKLNFNVIWAVNGLEAVEKFKTYKDIEIVFMDLILPELNGKDAALQIKNINKDVFIIAQTALQANDCSDLQIFDAIIYKPLNFNKIKNTTIRLLKMSNENKIAKSLLKIKAVELNPQHPFTWASGLLSPIYCDNRKTLSYPEIRNQIKNAFIELIQYKYPDAELIAGVATGGIAIGAIIASELDLPFAYVRSSSKKHGLENLVEGVVSENQKVVVIEDLISTGSSSLQAVNALREKKCNILGLAAIFTYGFKSAIANFSENNCIFDTLTDFDTLLNSAKETNYISQNDFELLLKWRENPENWRNS